MVAYAAPGIEALVDVDLPAGATVRDAVVASGLLTQLALDSEAMAFAIFGQRADPVTPLVEGDRVELTRRLVVDPKTARRSRARGRG
jgi:putative ubiquitin-RnfH superfamily antitoxin RatB of RatAB toxin-antitoxin module